MPTHIKPKTEPTVASGETTCLRCGVGIQAADSYKRKLTGITKDPRWLCGNCFNAFEAWLNDSMGCSRAWVLKQPQTFR